MSKKQLQRFLREPLLHFGLIGSLLFIGFELINNSQEMPDDIIVISSGRVSQLKSQFKSTWKRAPTPTELDNLIEGFVREEVYYRDALLLGLDQNDAVVRRRMRQKMEFLLDTGSYLAEPVAGELEAWYAANQQAYHQSDRLAVEHIFFGEYPEPETIAQSIAVLNTDQNIDPGTMGVGTLLPSRLGLSTSAAVDNVFGQGFFDQLFALQQEKWAGPVESAFGIHLVRVYDRVPGRTPILSEIPDLVQRDWREAKAKEVRENDYLQRRSRFVIEIERDDES